MLECLYTEINRGPSSFNCSREASRQKSGLRLSLSTIMSLLVLSFLKRKILSQNFATIARQVVLSRKGPRTISEFSSVFDPQPNKGGEGGVEEKISLAQ